MHNAYIYRKTTPNSTLYYLSHYTLSNLMPVAAFHVIVVFLPESFFTAVLAALRHIVVQLTCNICICNNNK